MSQLRSWVNAPSPNRFSGLWLLNYAPGWTTTSQNIGRGAPSALGHPAIPRRAADDALFIARDLGTYGCGTWRRGAPKEALQSEGFLVTEVEEAASVPGIGCTGTPSAVPNTSLTRTKQIQYRTRTAER